MNAERSTTNKDCYTEEEIMQEIAPIFKDFFIARFRMGEGQLWMKFMNGERFVINVIKVS